MTDAFLALSHQKDRAFARKGLTVAAINGIFFSLDSMLLKTGLGGSPFCDPLFWLIAPLFAAGCHDLAAACLSLGINTAQGKRREVFRTLRSKPGRWCILGALIGAPLGMGGFLLALALAGPAYALPITTLYPAMAAVLARVFLKERISRRTGMGLICCVAGAAVISCAPATAVQGSPHLYLGIAFAFVAALGWAAEGVCAASGMDFIEPGIALNVYQLVSAALYFCLIIPAAAAWLVVQGHGPALADMAASALHSRELWLFFAAGWLGCLSYRCWYMAMNMIGVSRAMALNITYALWGILFSVFFMHAPVTARLLAGAGLVFCGVILVIRSRHEGIALRRAD